MRVPGGGGGGGGGTCPTPRLGGRRGALTDWLTQRWVQATGRPVRLDERPWLRAPTGDVDGIGADFFRRVADREGLRERRGDAPAGLLPSFAALGSPSFDAAAVHPAVREFYERTAEYEIDAWSQWCGIFRPFGRALAWLFSRRLQQMNVPLSGLDTAPGIDSDVVAYEDRDGGVRYAAWNRTLVSTGDVLYAGAYSVAEVPGRGPCVRVAFPLPNGSAIVLLRPEVAEGGALLLRSEGRGLDDTGFTFYVEDRPGTGWARHVRSLRETIRVFVDAGGTLRADHDVRLGPLPVLRLHYRMRRRPEGSRRDAG